MASGEKDVDSMLNGKFTFRKLPNGGIDKSKVICVYCHRELSYHRSTSSLKYHLMAKHAVDANAPAPRQNVSMDHFQQKQMDTATKKRLTEAIAKWVATACRPISIV